ncbi:hypothetical protein RRG08_050858 [Elysia crispata]|uniref:SCP domain-containing protein n=1 Tax=Elysia crispata TaxID=231223 RepID=A0AAE0ZFA2_9GAST|nr:hypothetical protein RRG08_050858 [Elysia crispata]
MSLKNSSFHATLVCLKRCTTPVTIVVGANFTYNIPMNTAFVLLLAISASITGEASIACKENQVVDENGNPCTEAGLGKDKTAASLEQFRQQALHKHNELRTLHSSPPLKLSDDLSAYAQAWAEHMASVGRLYHSKRTLDTGEKVGENIAMMSNREGIDFSGEAAVQMWYSKISKYDFSEAKGQPGTGSFTSVVWKDTKELGMGKASTADGNTFYAVACYRPPGSSDNSDSENWIKNVLRPSSN